MKIQMTHSSESAAIDELPELDAMHAMLASHVAALEAIDGAVGQIAAAARVVASGLEADATIHYVAAGSSGLMALADACELPGTFQIPHSQIRVCMAGGVPVSGHMPGDTEDSHDDAVQAAMSIKQGDVAIVVSASGTTPYALAFVQIAQSRGAQVVGIANVAGSALLEVSDVPITLNTGPEVVEGSTRLGAGTAQKAALNMISTQVGVLMGHVHDGMMVNLKPDNIKLRRRAATIVSRIAHVEPEAAERALTETSYNTKLAVLVAAGVDAKKAQDILNLRRGYLKACLQDIAAGSKIAN